MSYQIIHLYLRQFAAGHRFYAFGLRVIVPGATSANAWLAWFRKHYEIAPEHIVQMWELRDGKPGALLYESKGAQS